MSYQPFIFTSSSLSCLPWLPDQIFLSPVKTDYNAHLVFDIDRKTTFQRDPCSNPRIGKCVRLHGKGKLRLQMKSVFPVCQFQNEEIILNHTDKSNIITKWFCKGESGRPKSESKRLNMLSCQFQRWKMGPRASKCRRPLPQNRQKRVQLSHPRIHITKQHVSSLMCKVPMLMYH